MPELHPGDKLRYRGNVVGRIDQVKGLRVFKWGQTPFKAFSSETELAFGMGLGLIDKLQEEDVTFVEVHGELVPVDELEECELLLPTHDVFNEMPPEAQRIIKIDR